jgi:multicomponent Na+:H+ antiporter subunit E
MRKTIYLFITLALFWLLLSGHYTALLISFGIISCCLVVAIITRMDTIDGSHVSLTLYPVHFVKYWVWLAKEIIVSNIAVTKLVLSREIKISPSIFRVPAVNLSELLRVTYANSITLTPGTVSIDVGDDWIEVHALTDKTRSDLLAGRMGERVRTIGAGPQQ